VNTSSFLSNSIVPSADAMARVLRRLLKSKLLWAGLFFQFPLHLLLRRLLAGEPLAGCVVYVDAIRCS
jgi:hypothetical protein